MRICSSAARMPRATSSQRVIRLEALERADAQARERVGVLLRDLLDLDSALLRQHVERLLRASVERDREVVLLRNVGRLFDPELADDMAADVEAEDVARPRLRVVGIVSELDPARLAAPAREHLRLDDDGAAELLGGPSRFLRGRRQPPVRDGYAEAPEELLALVLVEIHRRGRVYLRAPGPAPGQRLAHAQPEALEELGNRLRLHLERVALRQLRECLGVGLRDTAQVDELLEEPLEPGRRDDLEDPARLVAGIPERVPLVSRLEYQVARASLDDVVAEQRTHASLQHEAVFVLARVEVERRGERARRHRMLDEREALASLVAVDQETDADGADESLAPLGRGDDLRPCGGRAHSLLL